VGTGDTYAEALTGLLRVDNDRAELILLPSSLRRDDRLASAVLKAFRQSHANTHLVLPANPIAALTRPSRKSSESVWATITTHPPDSLPKPIRIPARLVTGSHIWSVTNVDAVHGSGPFVLDLLARYVHPVSRVRHLATRSRADAAVDVNLAVTISSSVIGKEFPGHSIVGVCHDPIAAELFALALADEDLSADRIVSGPWEDRVIQRATELELGVQIPEQIAITFAREPGQDVRDMILRVTARMGIEAT
jgi:hypothetical protein